MSLRETDAKLKICGKLIDFLQTPMFSNETFLGSVNSGYNALSEAEKQEYKANQTKAKNTILLTETLMNETLEEVKKP